MFKEENRIYWYLVGVVLMMALLLYSAKEYFIPFIMLEPVFERTPAFSWRDEPRFSLDLSRNYFATIYTNQGAVIVDLYELSAPRNVNNFIFLANENYYDGTKFHRLIPDFLLQGGDRNTLDEDAFNDGRGGPGYLVPDEVNWDALDLSQEKREQLSANGYSTTPGLDSRRLTRYSLVMASSLPNTNGSQFFFVLADETDPRLELMNGQFTVIGQVYSGVDLFGRAIAAGVDDPNAANPRPKLDIVIEDIQVFTR